MTAPDAPFPTTAAAVARRLPGRVRGAFADGADAIVSSTSPATCRARSRAPRSPGACCPTARSTSSTRRAASMGVGHAGPDRRRDGGRGRLGRRDRPCPRGARARTSACSSPSTRSSTSSAAAGSAARRPRSGRSCRSSRSSRSRRDRRERPTACGPAEGARAAASSCSPRGRSSGSRSSTRSAPTSTVPRRVLARVPGGIDRRRSDGRLVGPRSGRTSGPGCVGAVALYREPDARGPATGDGQVAGRCRTAHGIRSSAAILGSQRRRPCRRPFLEPATSASPWGRPGDGPSIAGGRRTARHTEDPPFHDDGARHGADQPLGTSRSSSSTWRPSASTSTPACAASCASHGASSPSTSR